MRKLLTQLIKAIPLILLMLAFVGVNAQRRYSPLAATGLSDFSITLRNDVQVDCKNLTFDLYVLDVDNTQPFELAAVQAGITVNSAIYNGGTITMSIVPGSSDLESQQVPTSVIWVQSQNCIKLTPKSPPGAGNGQILSTVSPGMRICTLKMTNTVNFAQAPVNETFSFTTVPYPTKIAQYISGTNTQLVCSTANCFNALTNPTLTCGSPPVAYATGVYGNNPYCEGSTAPSITLANSQTGVTYQLYQNTVASGSTVPGTDGLALSWTNETAGSYTVVGTNGLGSTNMTGTQVITMNPLPGPAGVIVGTTYVVQGTPTVPFSVPTIANAASYVWAYSGTGATINGSGSSITISFSASATSGQVSVYGLNSCGPGASAYFSVNLESTTFQWTGAVNSDWFNGGNWNSTYVPGTGNDVIIPLVATLPVISGTTLAVCGAVTVNSGATITVNGKFSPAGTITLNGNNALIINDGGSFIDNGIAGTGTAKVLKSMPVSHWHYISSPISNGLSGIFTSDWLVVYSAAYANGWLTQNYIIDPGIPLVPEQGYAAYILSTNTSPVVFSGHLNTNAPAIACAVQQFPAGTGYNLVGNAYPSAIDLANGNIIWPTASHTAYFWDPVNESYKIYTTTLPSHSQYAPAVQAFFIEAATAGNFQVPNSARLHSSEAFLKDAGTYPNVLKMSATSQANGKVDEAVVGFVPGTTAGYDNNYDAAKLAGGTETPQIFSLLPDNQKVAYDIMPSVNETTVVPMGFTCGVNGSFTINASNLESFDASTRIYLEDLKEATIQDLKANPAYAFDYTTGDAANRFVLHFASPTGISNMQANGVQVYTYESSLYIKNLDNQSLKNVFVYDLLGKEVFQSALNSSPLQKFVLGVNQGYYVVKVISATGVTTQKVYIN